MNKLFCKGNRIFVCDKMQQGYSYILTCNPGQDFAPEFKLELTPAQMLARGVFEGHYLTDCRLEFPAEWFERAKLSPSGPNISLNQFGIKLRQCQALLQWAYNPDF